MTSALILSSQGPAAPPLADDLAAAGIQVLGHTGRSKLVQDVLQTAPDLLVCFEQSPDDAFFAGIAAVAATAARPVAVFTMDPDAGKIAAAIRAGVHAYEVASYSRARLRSVVHLAQSRFEHEQALRQELDDVRRRFEERKLVDRAKGILMGARQLREEEAFRALRDTAMASQQRIGQVARIVIDGAHYAEAINRAGQLRMLSQRLVKLYALACAGIAAAETARLFAHSIEQVSAILAMLGRTLSKPTFGDLLHATLQPWASLHELLRKPARTALLSEADDLAEALLEHADRLTAGLEVAAYASALHAINVAGRQRMLSQRLAKDVLIGSLLNVPRPIAPTQDALVEGLAYLDALPLSNAEITAELAQTGQAWVRFQADLAGHGTAAGREGIAASSEDMLAHFGHLTNLLERAIQAFIR